MSVLMRNIKEVGMNLDPELKAMSDVYTALKDLDDDAKRRIVNWIAEKFSVPLQTKGRAAVQRTDQPTDVEKIDLSSFDSVGDVFSRSGPKSDSEKVLIV